MFQGNDVTAEPLEVRKDLLHGLLGGPRRPNILLVDHFEGGRDRLFGEGPHTLKLEGLVAKRADSTYQPGVRSSDWVKVKRRGAIPAERFKREPW